MARLEKSLSFGALALLFAAFMAADYKIATHLEHATIEVVGKERIAQVSSGKDTGTTTRIRNFVYTQDETYEVKDSPFNWAMRSGTVYAQIHEGETCDVTLSGYRVGWLSMYQNIIGAMCHGK